MKSELQMKAWHIENLIEADDNAQVIPLSDANEIMEKKDEEIRTLRKALTDAMDWNWISENEANEDADQDYYDIPEMQEIYELSLGGKS
jgi:hypothetical protein